MKSTVQSAILYLINFVGLAKHRHLYVDDVRSLPAGTNWFEWDVARTYDHTIALLTKHEYDSVSLDHDLADFDSNGRERTGLNVVDWMVERKHVENLYVPSMITVHSANPAARPRMEMTINRYLRT